MEKILKLLEEQSDNSQLIAEMAQCKTDDELLHFAHKLVVKYEEYGWLIEKVKDMYADSTKSN